MKIIDGYLLKKMYKSSVIVIILDTCRCRSIHTQKKDTTNQQQNHINTIRLFVPSNKTIFGIALLTCMALFSHMLPKHLHFSIFLFCSHRIITKSTTVRKSRKYFKTSNSNANISMPNRFHQNHN